MKKLLCLIPILLVGCSSGGNKYNPQYGTQELIMDRQIHAMSRNEIISAVQECEGNGLRASMVYSKRMINGKAADIVVDVTCAPRYRLY